ncbi:MAG TPA: ECF transporter S component [Candidatus Methylomirabilis sp.]|nr:ECF transporter S component [Candidatus Methylomirabilis sp.]HSC71134.1 ECF transporter S component [Candidatus Methylomirabilis sp.]
MAVRRHALARVLGWRKDVSRVVLAVILYLLLGNARSVQPNPFIPGAIIAVNMVIPVLSGILFGRLAGLLVGLLGTSLNAISPAGSLFELLSIIPHGIMGWVAGHFRQRMPTPILACSLIVGHGLNILMYVLFGALSFASLLHLTFWYGLTYETFAGVVAVTILAGIYRLGFQTSRA